MGKPGHKEMLQNRTKSWGKQKFKPAPFSRNRAPAPIPDPEEAAQPWQHVKNDLIEDAAEAGNAGRLDADSEKAKEFRKQREQNHRRNIIEAKRNEITTWESFEDEPTPSKGKQGKNKKEPGRSTFAECDVSKGELPTNAENFTFKERDFYRRKVTLGVSMANRKPNLNWAIQDLSRYGVKAPPQQARGAGYNVKESKQKKGMVTKPKKELTDARKNNPFQKKSIEY
ncbi:uncharacterized protein LOC108162280 [Drosophila miranda]|uniref:uncharacterized protein LOC108162280 n=1 Tax=Drosophila miranda TaxID=7229 RepID=UPI0007E741AD|nr:uncharacterized protein LOC108162280 [Drosophila miranda]